jgi:deaminated glutathione amidase
VGGSLVASPLGEVVVAAEADPRLLVVDIDLKEVENARKTLAVLHNRAEIAHARKAESLG